MVKTSPGRPVDLSKDRDILAAGRALLFENGPQAVTMEAVARQAGVAKPTLYRRYANRDELLAAVAMNESESMAGRFRVTPGSVDDMRSALVDFGCQLTRFLLSSDHIRFIHALGASTGMPQASRESIFRHGPLATRDRLAEWLEKADASGLLPGRVAGKGRRLRTAALSGSGSQRRETSRYAHGAGSGANALPRPSAARRRSAEHARGKYDRRLPDTAAFHLIRRPPGRCTVFTDEVVDNAVTSLSTLHAWNQS